jgi:hypothetical protein
VTDLGEPVPPGLAAASNVYGSGGSAVQSTNLAGRGLAILTAPAAGMASIAGVGEIRAWARYPETRGIRPASHESRSND